MTPPHDDDSGDLTRRDRRRLRAPAPSFDEVAGRSDATTPAAQDAGAPAAQDAAIEDAEPIDALLAEATEGAESIDEPTTESGAASSGDAERNEDAEPAAEEAVRVPAPVAALASDGEPVDTDAAPAGDTTPPADDIPAPVGDDLASVSDGLDAPVEGAPATAEWASTATPATALLWVDPAAIAAAAEPGTAEEETSPDTADILSDAHAHGPRGWLVPVGFLVALGVAYSATALLWPLNALPPTVTAAEITIDPAEPAALTWPADGGAAISVSGVGTASDSSEAVPIASITKVVSVMLVLEQLPLQVGEQGPEYSFTRSDSRDFWTYLRDNQSALDVPVGGTLTEYQMLQGILLGSANNYIDRLADEIWGSERAFADAAENWLSARGLGDITIVTPAGRSSSNVATPESLTRLADIAMSNPVFAEIVGTASVDLPGAGTVTNSNGLLGEPGIVGVKTGTLGGDYNLLSAKDVTVGDTTVRLYAAVLGQEDNDARLEASRVLYSEVEAALQAQGTTVAAGTVVGDVTTEWGATAEIVSDADAKVVLWNAATATATVDFELGENTAEGAEVGTLTVAGPLESLEVPVSLAEELAGPSPWWRLTHPLELFGINAD